MNRVRPAFAAVLPLIFALPVIWVVACAIPGAQGSGPVYLALAAPLRDAKGQPYALGESSKLGAELAQKEINAAGGIGGRQLELVIHDDWATEDTAIRVSATVVADERVIGVAGHSNSGNVVKAARNYEGNVSAVATCATSPSISQAGEWTFRIASSDVLNAAILAREARRLSGRVAVLYTNNDFGRGLSAPFVEEYLRLGGDIVERDPFHPTQEDFTPYLRRIQSRGINVVFIAGVDAGAITIIRQARELGLNATFLGSSALERLRTLGPVYDGTVVGMLYHPQSSPEARRFAAAFRAAYGRDPDSFAACAYDAVNVLAEAVRRGGASRREVHDALIAMQGNAAGAAWKGATGAIQFDANGDPVGKRYILATIRNGALVAR
jgi:branched-chain amino acid transport system substrate-binding protein